MLKSTTAPIGKAPMRFGLYFLLLTTSASAWADSMPVAQGSIIRDYARVTFEWPEPVYFTAKTEGNSVALTFDHKANPDLSPLLAQLAPYITHAERKADGKTVVLTLNHPYRIRTFVSDTINGIDLLDIDAKERPPARRKAAKKKPLAVAQNAVQLAALSPAAGHKQAPPSPTPPPAPPVAGDGAALSSQAAAPKPAVTANAALKVSVSAAEDSAILRFPFTSRTAFAAFVRGRTLWIVFNQTRPLDLTEFEQLPHTVVGKPVSRAQAGNNILRVPLQEGVSISVAKEESTFDWAVLVTPVARALRTPLAIAVNTDPPAPANVFVPTLEMAEPLTLTDPDVGDELIVIPLYKPGEGVAEARRFIEFTLLPTAQGVAVQKMADDVTVAPLRNGMRISLPQGATLSPGMPEIENKNASDKSTLGTLLPYAIWKSEEPDKLHNQLRDLFRQVVAADSQSQASNARLRMAQLNLSEGLAVEALAQLDAINRTDPSYYRSMKLAAMRGAANFLLYRFPEAGHDFAASELNNNKEMDYWRAMLSELQGNPDQHYDYLALNEDYISKYPPVLRQRLAIVSAGHSLDGKAYNTALKIIDTLEESKINLPVEPYINFLLAKIYADTEKSEPAQALLDKLADDYAHPFVRARAEYSRIAWGLEHSTLPKDQAIDRLEKLRLSWHGDSLELSVATLLGDLYAEKKNYADAMRVWYGAVKSFPNTAEAIDMARKLQENFVALFNEGVADKMPPIEALALYYQYRAFTPEGHAGNLMAEHIADRLMALDLLEQAASLLDHQMHFSSEKEDRSRLGGKLASIYLANHQSKKGLQALADSVYGDNTLPLRLLRNQLIAENLADIGKPDDALAVLGKDKTPESERIRQDIYWKARDWPHLIESAEALLKARKDITAPVTLLESESLLKLALAYNFQNEATQLQYLHDYYGPLTKDSPNHATFDYLTSLPLAPKPDNFDAVMQEIDGTREFLAHYKTHGQVAANRKWRRLNYQLGQ